MGRIFCLIGKSCSGKDTLFNHITENYPELIPIIPYTTRPIRQNEVDGKQYHFIDRETMLEYERKHLIIEKREYYTTQGVWTYFTRDFDISDNCAYIMISTLIGVQSLIKRYGNNVLTIVYLHLDEKKRLLRCIDRESEQSNPDYNEVCRRFIADNQDFSSDRLSSLNKLYQINTGDCVAHSLKQWKHIYDENK